MVSEGSTSFFQCLVNDIVGKTSHNVVLSSRIENSELWSRYCEFRRELRKRLGDGEASASLEGDLKDRFGQVERDVKELTKWPCKFFMKGECKHGAKCRFSHSRSAGTLSNVALSAGRRLPLDELDHGLNERFLWYAGTKRQSVQMSKGNFSKDECSVYAHSLQPFFFSLRTALPRARSSQGTKYAVLCRVICGSPGDTSPTSPKSPKVDRTVSKDTTCIVPEQSSAHDVLIPKPCQVYPEYIIELNSDEDRREDAAITIQKWARGRSARKFVAQCVEQGVSPTSEEGQALRGSEQQRLENTRQESGQSLGSGFNSSNRDLSLPGL